MQKLIWTLLCLATTLVPEQARAQDRTTILGIRSVEGDDGLERAITAELRSTAAEVPSWEMGPQMATLVQIAVAYGCSDDISLECLSRVASSMQVRYIIYGVLRRSGVEVGSDRLLNLTRFDAESGTIIGQAADSFPPSEDALPGRGRDWLEQLGASFTEPEHEVPVVEVPPVDGADQGVGNGGPDALFWAGLVLTVAGVGSFAGAVASWVRLDEMRGDPDFDAYRDVVPRGMNACTAANGDPDADRIRGLCADADLFEVLQVVFVVTAALAGGAGIPMTVVGLSSGQEGVSLQPTVSPDQASLALSYRF